MSNEANGGGMGTCALDAALAAVIPAIQAEALERAAAKLAGIAELHRAAARVLLDAKNMAGAERRETQAVAYDSAAAAIRALKEGT